MATIGWYELAWWALLVAPLALIAAAAAGVTLVTLIALAGYPIVRWRRRRTQPGHPRVSATPPADTAANGRE